MSATRVPGELLPDPARVIAHLYLPGEELRVTRSRAGQVVERVMAIEEDEVTRLVDGLVNRFGERHVNYPDILERNASTVSARVSQAAELSPARRLLLGATFTAEYAVEGAALCNPSAVRHPDQTGLDVGQVRVALSVRGIGEGHISSIGFCSAIIGPGVRWQFEPRPRPLAVAVTGPADWQREHLRAALAGPGHLDELSEAILHALPAVFDPAELERCLAQAPPDLLARPGSAASVDRLRSVVASAYTASFAPESNLAQRVLFPSAAEESNGMEDARFTRFLGADGSVEYRATYTAYDGHRIAPRLLISADLQVFQAHRLAGDAARNKGMALFPRLVNGRHLALCRTDGESNSLASSPDGLVWGAPIPLQSSQQPWEVLQIGNCGPPIETEHGWLVLTHGVGPMRVYSMGALLLDLDDPTRVIARSANPLLAPTVDDSEGYVPNVVYSCGAFLHDEHVWIPYGVGDSRIRVAYSRLDALLESLTRVS